MKKIQEIQRRQAIIASEHYIKEAYSLVAKGLMERSQIEVQYSNINSFLNNHKSYYEFLLTLKKFKESISQCYFIKKGL